MKGDKKKLQTVIYDTFSKIIEENEDLKYFVKECGIETTNPIFVSEMLKEMVDTLNDPNQIECNKVMHKLMQIAENKSLKEFREQEAKHSSKYFKRLRYPLDYANILEKTENLLTENEKLQLYLPLCLILFEGHYSPQINLLSYFLVISGFEKFRDRNGKANGRCSGNHR